MDGHVMSSMTIAAALKAHGAQDQREQWLCDSFNGLPKPDASRCASSPFLRSPLRCPLFTARLLALEGSKRIVEASFGKSGAILWVDRP